VHASWLNQVCFSIIRKALSPARSPSRSRARCAACWPLTPPPLTTASTGSGRAGGGSPAVPAIATLGSRAGRLTLYRPGAGLPRLHLPSRDYLLLRGPLSGTLALSRYHESRHAWQSPNLLWAADRAWFLASEIDFDSTLVAGDTDLIADILACPALESWPVHPQDSLASDGDTLNPTNERALQRTRPRDGLFRKLATRLAGR